MADLSKEDVKCLGLAVGIDLDDPMLTEVTFNLNAIREQLDLSDVPELSGAEPLPVIPPHQRSRYE